MPRGMFFHTVFLDYLWNTCQYTTSIHNVPGTNIHIYIPGGDSGICITDSHIPDPQPAIHPPVTHSGIHDTVLHIPTVHFDGA